MQGPEAHCALTPQAALLHFVFLFGSHGGECQQGEEGKEEEAWWGIMLAALAGP